jgi:hypothetical protein
MSYTEFNIAIWHPFGPHGRETVEQIIERKRREIKANGWTLWSFQYRRPEVLEEWSRYLSAASEMDQIAFCSYSPDAVDPADAKVPIETTDCKSYRFAGQAQWRPWPNGIKVPHPFRGKRRHASAFVVKQIIYPIEHFSLPNVQWLSHGAWQESRVPTRGEYLMRRGGIVPLRRVRAVLKLQEPFLTTVSADTVEVS